MKSNIFPKQASDKYWKENLSEESYRILREKGTEPPFSGKYNLHFENGYYLCKACENPLFKSGQKFDSGCGWPSFDDAIKGSVKNILDKSHGMIRTEIVCNNCGGHLGHVFNDGPTETGQRYCVNSLSVDFKKE
ncbi:MAG: peptide-methionine (R)-S-oxide reductase MsrB [Flavobacteriaceae bacterium]|jgi:peptide-methionine (R)-S-oxide reductase|nr:peptide-methionine (R)-S-oxide reductase MsrB [Flavobacteriaceae bacterium]|tara:strand:- start:11385 stop:11786 length:402 start_codon:yes stop_codon:yes gene_type:complete